MSGTTVAPPSPWRPFATTAYLLAVLVVLAPAIAFAFAVLPPNPWLLSWRHISSDMLLSSAPAIGLAAVATLLAAKARGDRWVLEVLRMVGFAGLVLALPFVALYTVDALAIYRDLAAPQARTFLVMEIRMLTMMALGIVLLVVVTLAARRGPDGAGAPT